jgi:hypothetical protein
MNGNKTEIEDIMVQIEGTIQSLAVLRLHPPPMLHASISSDAVARVAKFNEHVPMSRIDPSPQTNHPVSRRLDKIKMSTTGHAVKTRNIFQRLLDAERISEELHDAWKDISFAFDELIVSIAS